MKNNPRFEVILIALIFDPLNKKILIAKRKDGSKEFKWCFPGGWAEKENDVDKTLKRKIQEKTGYRIKNLGSIFSRIHPENKETVEIYFLTEVFEGKEIPGGNIVETKWINPKELENHLTSPMHRKLKQFLNELVE